MRKERGIDHRWQIRKYCGNIALFAHCKCGFEYPCSSNKRRGTCLENSGSVKLVVRVHRPPPYVKRTQAALSIRWKRIGSVKGMEIDTSS